MKKLIRFVAITSSRVASTGGNSADNSVDPDDNTQALADALTNQGGGALNAQPDLGDFED